MVQYQGFFTARRLPYPPWPRHGFLVVEGETLLAAAGLYLTGGPYAIVEAFATNPTVAARVRHAAVEFLLRAVLLMTAVLDVTVTMTPSDKARGVIGMARRLGFMIGTERPVFGGFQ